MKDYLRLEWQNAGKGIYKLECKNAGSKLCEQCKYTNNKYKKCNTH